MENQIGTETEKPKHKSQNRNIENDFKRVFKKNIQTGSLNNRRTINANFYALIWIKPFLTILSRLTVSIKTLKKILVKTSYLANLFVMLGATSHMIWHIVTVHLSGPVTIVTQREPWANHDSNQANLEQITCCGTQWCQFQSDHVLTCSCSGLFVFHPVHAASI